MTGLSAAVGVLGIGLGWWWADAVAALVIAVDVLHDGYGHTMSAVRDLMDKAPRTVDGKEIDPLPRRAKAIVEGLPWVRSAKMRFREEGRFLVGTLFVVPDTDEVDPRWVEEAEERVQSMHWRLAQVSVVPLPDISRIQEQAQEGSP